MPYLYSKQQGFTRNNFIYLQGHWLPAKTNIADFRGKYGECETVRASVSLKEILKRYALIVGVFLCFLQYWFRPNRS
jgi:hypothetical protein